MFPVKLSELCSIYKVTGKLGEALLKLQKPEYNKLTILDDCNMHCEAKRNLDDLLRYNAQDATACFSVQRYD